MCFGDKNQEKFGLRRVIETLKFFHKMTNAHNRKNFLAKIKVNGGSGFLKIEK